MQRYDSIRFVGVRGEIRPAVENGDQEERINSRRAGLGVIRGYEESKYVPRRKRSKTDLSAEMTEVCEWAYCSPKAGRTQPNRVSESRTS